MEEHVNKVTISESVLIGDLQNTIQKRKLNKLEKKVFRPEVQVQEEVMRVKVLLTINSSNDSRGSVSSQKLGHKLCFDESFVIHNDAPDSDTTQSHQI